MNTITIKNYCKYCDPFSWFALLHLNPEREMGNLTILIDHNQESAFNEEIYQVWEDNEFALPISTFLSKSVIKVFGRITEISGRYHIQGFDSSFGFKDFLKRLLKT